MVSRRLRGGEVAVVEIGDEGDGEVGGVAGAAGDLQAGLLFLGGGDGEDDVAVHLGDAAGEGDDGGAVFALLDGDGVRGRGDRAHRAAEGDFNFHATGRTGRAARAAG